MENLFTITKDGILLPLKVTPKASKNKIGCIASDIHGRSLLKIYVTTPPEDGKANTAVIALLAKAFGISKKQITIYQGETSRHKIVKITPKAGSESIEALHHQLMQNMSFLIPKLH